LTNGWPFLFKFSITGQSLLALPIVAPPALSIFHA
jgi:hypothetical protein